jgi:hypothetical protein
MIITKSVTTNLKTFLKIIHVKIEIFAIRDGIEKSQDMIFHLEILVLGLLKAEKILRK